MVDTSYVGGIGGVGGVDPRPQTPGTAKPDGANFKDYLSKSIQEIETLQAKADKEIEGLVTGEVTNLSQVMVAVEQANLAFSTMMEIRNKILTAYEEIQRMPI